MPSCKPPPFDELNPRWSMNLEPINSFEPTNSAEILARRKESARHTLRTASPEELHALVEELFPDGTHPWAATFSQFIDEHRSERAIRGETSDAIAFVYYPRPNLGMWCKRAGGTVQGHDFELFARADIGSVFVRQQLAGGAKQAAAGLEN